MPMESVQSQEETTALDVLLTLPLRGENPYIKEWKRSGGKVFGYVCSYVPEEILWAHEGPGRILPIRMGAQGCDGTEDADIHMNRFMCGYLRSLVGCRGQTYTFDNTASCDGDLQPILSSV